MSGFFLFFFFSCRVPARSETCSDVFSVCYRSLSQENNFDELEEVQVILLSNKQMVVFAWENVVFSETLMEALDMQERHITCCPYAVCCVLCCFVRT